MRGRQAAPGPPADDRPDALSRLLADDPEEAARARGLLGPLAPGQAAEAEAAAAWLLAEAPPPPADLVDRVMDRVAAQGTAAHEAEDPRRAATAKLAHRRRWPLSARWPRPRHLLLAGGLAGVALAIGLSLGAGGGGGLSGAALGQGASWYLPATGFSLILGLVLIVLAVYRR